MKIACWDSEQMAQKTGLPEPEVRQFLLEAQQSLLEFLSVSDDDPQAFEAARQKFLKTSAGRAFAEWSGRHPVNAEGDENAR